MLCQACKERSATIHLTEINNGQRNETHLCPQCAKQQGLSVQTQIPLNELLNTLLSTQQGKTQDSTKPSIETGGEHACPVCGMTLKRFAKDPLLGCPHDYAEFQPQLLPLIEQSHNGKNYHCGKHDQIARSAARNDAGPAGNVTVQLEDGDHTARKSHHTNDDG